MTRLGATGCKTVGSAYVGSNPTPATTCENGPLAGNSRLCGPFCTVPPCVGLCRRRAACGGGYGRMADEIRAGRAVGVTAGFPRTATDGRRLGRFRLTGGAESGVFRDLLLREGRLAGRVPHPGVVQVRDYNDDSADGVPYLVMEYVAGPRSPRSSARRDAVPSLCPWPDRAGGRGACSAETTTPLRDPAPSRLGLQGRQQARRSRETPSPDPHRAGTSAGASVAGGGDPRGAP